MFFCPDPDITRALPAGRGPPGPAALGAPGPAGMLEVGPELLAERSGVLGVQVDLTVGAIEGEPHRLLCRAAGQVVFQRDGHFLGHPTLSLIAMVAAPYPGQCPSASRNAADHASNTGKGHGPAGASPGSPPLPAPFFAHHALTSVSVT